MGEFDVIRFLDDYNIEWWGKGENVSRGRVGVTCPFCNDVYNHLGLHKTGQKQPYCWKCGSHSWYDTIRALSGSNPREVIKQYGDILSMEAFSSVQKYETYATVCLPPGDKDFGEVHLKYLERRGFDPEYIIEKYDLRVTKGFHSYPFRIIIPIIFRNKIVSYQGRSYVNHTPKYLTCAPDKEVIFHKDIFFNLDNAKNENVIIVEGVFDAMKLGSNSIASFGTAITANQVLTVMNNYDRVFMLYDGEDEAQEKARKAAVTLSSAGVKVENICLDKGDAGDMNEDDVFHLKKELGVL